MDLDRARVLVPALGRPYVDGDSLDGGVPLVWVIPDLVPAEACAALIARIDALGPEVAPISTARGPVMDTRTRNNERVMFDDPALADELVRAARTALPARVAGDELCGGNERFRGYRYQPGQRFASHYDGAFVRGPTERSQLTFIVYLNDDFEGGHTDFDLGVSVAPAAGSALVFQHHLRHEGCPVTAGRKYVLRTDIMYRRAESLARRAG